MHQPLPFSSESRRNFRSRRIPSLTLSSVRSTLRSRSSSILDVTLGAVGCERRVRYALVVYIDLLAHERSLLLDRIQSACYRINSLVLLSEHHLGQGGKPADRSQADYLGTHLLLLPRP